MSDSCPSCGQVDVTTVTGDVLDHNQPDGRECPVSDVEWSSPRHGDADGRRLPMKEQAMSAERSEQIAACQAVLGAMEVEARDFSDVWVVTSRQQSRVERLRRNQLRTCAALRVTLAGICEALMIYDPGEATQVATAALVFIDDALRGDR